MKGMVVGFVRIISLFGYVWRPFKIFHSFPPFFLDWQTMKYFSGKQTFEKSPGLQRGILSFHRNSLQSNLLGP